MKVFGIIIEANPLHKGHEYLINYVKNNYQPDCLIAITSTSFTMRGEISLLDKFTKTKLLLNAGFDLVFELPFTYAIQSADYFASNSIKILNKLQITDLVFGCETKAIGIFNELYKTNHNINNNSSLSYKDYFNDLISNNENLNNYRELINQPNFTLGYAYYKYIKNNNLNININLVQRVANNYYDKITTSSIASATSIRNLLLNNSDPSEYISYSKDLLIDINKTNDNFLILLRHTFLTNNINTDYEEKEGLFNYIKNNGNFWNNLTTLQNSLKNKKYTINKINRVFLHSIIGTNNIDNKADYLRLLGTNQKGLEYIKVLNKEVKNLIFSSPKEIINEEIKKVNNYELLATTLYQNITNKEDLYLKEFKLPIRKDKI